MIELVEVLILLIKTILGAFLFIVSSGHWAGEAFKNNTAVRVSAGLLAAFLTYLALEPLFSLPRIEPVLSRGYGRLAEVVRASFPKNLARPNSPNDATTTVRANPLPIRASTVPVPANPIDIARTQESGAGNAPPSARFENLDEQIVPSKYKRGDTFRDCTDCPEMVVLPSGSSIIGEIEEPRDVHLAVSGLPPFHVTIKYQFALSKCELTMKEYRVCQLEGGCPHVPTKYTGRYVILKLTDQHPVIASWNDAQKYVGWLSRKTGRRYRLPSEAEWEFAARAGTRTPFWYGSEYDPSKANSQDWSTIRPLNSQTEDKPVIVGQYPPNPWGLYDMYGNVGEWVQDCDTIFWSADQIRTRRSDREVAGGEIISIAQHPVNGSAYENLDQCKKWGGTTWGGKPFAYRVFRGGAFYQDSGSFPLSYSRDRMNPSSQEEGIRIATTLSN